MATIVTIYILMNRFYSNRNQLLLPTTTNHVNLFKYDQLLSISKRLLHSKIELYPKTEEFLRFFLEKKKQEEVRRRWSDFIGDNQNTIYIYLYIYTAIIIRHYHQYNNIYIYSH